jgi:hypothetical protein
MHGLDGNRMCAGLETIMKLVRDTTGEVMDMPPPEIAVIPVGALQANCYLVTCPETRETIIIDPGADAAAIARHIREHDLPVSAIVHTHGHFDHINATEAVLEELGQSGPVIAHAADAFLYAGEARAAGAMFGYLAPPRLMIPDLTRLRLARSGLPCDTHPAIPPEASVWSVVTGAFFREIPSFAVESGVRTWPEVTKTRFMRAS